MTSLNSASKSARFRIWIAVVAIMGLALALSTSGMRLPVIAATTAEQAGSSAPILASLPAGYRNWALISVATVGSPVNDIRAKLGNEIAIAAFQAAKIRFPDGAIIARLAWKRVTSENTNSAIAQEARAKGLSADAIQKLLSETFVAGPPTNVQFMIKDSTKYASTGGWGFAQFTNGKPDNVVAQDCFVCHSPNKDRDFVFTTYAP